MGGFSPALPLLQSDQGTSAAIAGLHGTALGIASIIAGFLNAPLVHRFGRYRTSWIGLSIFNLGALCFIISPGPLLTIPAMLLAGIGLSTTVNNTITYVSHHFAEHQTRAVSQVNSVNSFFFLLGNILIGFIAGTAVSWRLGLLICIPFAIILYLLRGRNHRPEHIPDEDGHQRGSLSRNYWWAWCGLLFTIAAEFAILFWSSALLRERTSLSAATATTLVLAFPLGMVIGRWFGTHIFPNFSIDQRLKVFLSVQIIGFAVLWISEQVLLSFTALFFVGLGTSMQFVLSTLRLLKFAKGKEDLAIGRSSYAAGLAIGGSPFILGALSDQFGITAAFLIAPLFMLIGFAILIAVPAKEGTDEL